MTDQDEFSIPTARQAMRYAVALAGDITATELDLDRARTWVLIAAELRAGAMPLEALGEIKTEVGVDHEGTVEFFRRQGAIRRVDPNEDYRPKSADIPNRDADLAADAERWAEPEPRLYREAAGEPATQRLGLVLPKCAHCGLWIKWYSPDARPAQWVHAVTEQVVCPPGPETQIAPAEDMTITVVHTFATPAVPQGSDQ